jgi:hypothetical protein
MQEKLILKALTDFFGERGFTLLEPQGDTVRFALGEQHWQLALCADQNEEMDSLRAFEAGMQRLIAIRQASEQESGDQLGLALSLEPVLAAERGSYRRSLKKYTNSIVFEDMGIALLLVSAEGVELVAASEVNEFLRGLDERMRVERRG